MNVSNRSSGRRPKVDEIIQKFVKQGEPAEGRRLQFRYLCSPTRVVANDKGGVAALEAEENEMVLQDGRTVAKGTGKFNESTSTASSMPSAIRSMRPSGCRFRAARS